MFFESSIDGILFGIFATFLTGVFTSIIARVNLNNYNKSNNLNA